MSENEQKGCLQRFWKIIVGIGVILAILADFSGFTDIKLPDILKKDDVAKCIMPDLIGLSESIAILQIKNMGLTPIKKNTYNTNHKKGIVISQYPIAEKVMPKCKGEVIVEISSSIEKDKLIEKVPTPNSDKDSDGFNFWELIVIILGLYFTFKVIDFIL